MERIDQGINDWEREYSSWFLVNNPAAILGICLGYLYFVYKCGPRYMENRKPYKMKTYLIFYNVAQVLACLHIVKTIEKTVPSLALWRCQFYDKNSEQERIMRKLFYFVFLLKLVELTETIVFTLRAKTSQISKLHVIHHLSVVYLTWLLVRHVEEGRGIYPVYVNSYVHIIMYSYYLLAVVLDKDTLKKLQFVKRSITIIQMVQFIVLLSQTILDLKENCEPNKFVLLSHTSVLLLMLGMFYNFYRQTYKTKLIL